MQIYGIRFFNFFRFGEDCNSVLFDIPKEYMDRINADTDSLTFDEIYDILRQDPVSYIDKVKEEGTKDFIAICGIKGDNYDRSNGIGKSSIFEGICYAHYDKVVRRNVNTDKIEKAGTSVVTRFNGAYPKDLRQSYVEEIFEEKGKIYRIKRGRTFTASQKSHSPLVEFECISGEEVDSHASHRTGDTNLSIDNVTPWDYDVFINGAMFAQNDAGKFLIGTDKVRKEMLISLLKLEDIVFECLKKIRDRNNKQIKDNEGTKAQLEILLESFGSHESVETLDGKITELRKNIKESNIKIEKINDEITGLSKSDVIKKVASIKEEGSKIKVELGSQTELRKSQIKEWNNLYEESVRTEKSLLEKTETSKIKHKECESEIAKIVSMVENFDLDSRKKELERVEESKVKKPRYVSGIKKLQEDKEKILADIAEQLSNSKRCQKEKSSLEIQLQNSGEKEEFICDKCKSKVSRKHIENEIEKNVQLCYQYNADISENHKTQSTIENKLYRAQKDLDTINEYLIKEGKINSEIKENSTSKERIEEKRKSLKEYLKDQDRMSKELSELKKRQEEYKAKSSEVAKKYDGQIKVLQVKITNLTDEYREAQKAAGDIQAKINDLKKKKDEISQNEASYNSQIGSLTKEIETIKIDGQKIKSLRKDLFEGEQIHNHLVVLDDVFGLEGIQTRIIAKYLPLLNIYIKEFLDILSEGEMEAELFINSHSKVDMEIRGGSGDTFVMLSGGEKILVRLAVDIGLALLAFSRCSQKPEIICLDEIFGQLDGYNIKSVFRLLQNLRSKFSRVVLISHEANINSKIPHKILIEKEDGYMGRSKVRSIT